MEKAVTNATTLIFLAKINKLAFMKIYNPLLTTPIVYQEVLLAKDIPEMEKSDLSLFFKEHIQVLQPKKRLALSLGQGEASALSLAVEKKATLFLSDDKRARKTAEILSLQPLGTLGILLFHLREKNITREQAKQFLQLLIKHSYYISTETYARALFFIEQSNK